MNLRQAEKQQEEGFSDEGASDSKGINVNRKESRSTPGKAPSFRVAKEKAGCVRTTVGWGWGLLTINRSVGNLIRSLGRILCLTSSDSIYCFKKYISQANSLTF